MDFLLALLKYLLPVLNLPLAYQLLKRFTRPRIDISATLRLVTDLDEQKVKETRIFIQNQQDIPIEGPIAIRLPVRKDGWYYSDRYKPLSLVHGPIENSNRRPEIFFDDYGATIRSEQGMRPLVTWLVISHTKGDSPDQVVVEQEKEKILQQNLFVKKETTKKQPHGPLLLYMLLVLGIFLGAILFSILPYKSTEDPLQLVKLLWINLHERYLSGRFSLITFSTIFLSFVFGYISFRICRIRIPYIVMGYTDEEDPNSSTAGVPTVLEEAKHNAELETKLMGVIEKKVEAKFLEWRKNNGSQLQE